MGKVSGSVGRGAWLGAFFATLMLALVVPSMAFAANTATFSSAAPKANSSSTTARPKVSVTVYDKYGVVGSKYYSMKIDGKTVKPSLSYAKGYGHKKFTLSYTIKTDLTVAAHTAIVTVKDLKKHSSTYTWHFTVLDGTAPVTASDVAATYDGPATITLTATDKIGVAHTYYRLDGAPAVEGSVILVTCVVSGDHTIEFWSVDAAGNVEAHHTQKFFQSPTFDDAHVLPADITCTIAGCHSSDLRTIHETQIMGLPQVKGCSSCHVSASAPSRLCVTCHAIPANHSSHAATITSGTIVIAGQDFGSHECSECHDSLDLQTVHGGATSCSTCHPTPRSSITSWDGGCAQGDCHAGTSTVPMHGDIDTAHTLASVPSCTAADCHAGGTNAAAIHDAKGGPGCAACHGAGKTATLDCSAVGCHGANDSHPVADPHPGMTAGHTVNLHANCAKAGCHVADLPAIHADHGGCADCHGEGKTPSSSCGSGSDCHTAIENGSTHAKYVTAHSLESTPSCIADGCHIGGASVTSIHHCADCHAAGKPDLTTDCSTVGCHSASDPHPAAEPHPTMTASHTTGLNGSCVRGGCHVANLPLIHADALACATCHGANKTPTAACGTVGGCHETITNGGSHANYAAKHTLEATPTCAQPDCHDGGNNVTLIHGATHCSYCHTTGQELTLNCATEGCHGSNDPHPADDPHPAMTAGHSVGLTATCVKSGCHTSDLAAIHSTATGGPGCVVCHADGTTPTQTCGTVGCHETITSLAAPHVAPAAAHISDAGCVVAECHVANVALIHVKDGVSKCVACHADGVTPTLVCITCHKSGGVQPAPHTDITTDHTAGSSSCNLGVGCHSRNVAVIHAGACFACHASAGPHTTKCITCHTTEHSQANASHETTPGVAQSCGGPSPCHGDVSALDVIHAKTPLQCRSCHGNADHVLSGVCSDCHGIGGHTPKHDLPADRTDGCTGDACHDGTNLTTIKVGADLSVKHSNCSTCHQSARNDVKSAIVSGDRTCTACHGIGMPASHDSHPSPNTTGTITIAGVDYTNQACATCHPTMDLQDVSQHSTCSSCHPNPANSAVKGNFSCAQGNCHAGTSTIKMHAKVDTTAHAGDVDGCTATDCHTGDTNVAAIHSVVKNRSDHGCGLCHGSGALTASPTTLCASDPDCHPTGAPVSHESHPSTQTTGTITITGVGSATHACSECHSTMDLQDVSQHGTCSSCHPNPANSAAKGVFTCAQGNCHAGTSTIKMHASVDTTSHAASAASDCVTGGCHGGSTNVAAIHSTVTGHGAQGCGICHGSSALTPNPTLSCDGDADCHPTGAPGTHESHPSAQTTGTITITGVGSATHACSECHSTMDLQDVSQHGTCSSCHPNPANSAAKGVFTCAQGNCHAGTSTIKMHASVDTTSHAASAASDCVTGGCHGGSTNVAAIHSTVTGHGAQGCGICHGSSALTPNPTLSCDGDADCHPNGAPGTHESHPSTQTTGTITITGVGSATHACSECHSTMDLQDVAQHGTCSSCHPNPANSAAKGVFTCAQGNCHAGTSTIKMHASVDTTSHAGVVDGCTTGSACHAGGSNVAAIHSTVTGHGAQGCGICHGSSALTPTPTASCASDVDCHPNGAPESHSTHPSNQTTGTITITGLGATTHSCSECHSTMDLQDVAQHGDCTSCHPNPAGSAAKGVFTCAQGNCHAGTSTIKMHASVDTTAHVVTNQPGCITATCHASGNVALLHVKGGVQKCSACHNGRPLTTNCTSAAPCHGSTDPHPAHQSTVTSGTITIGTFSAGTHACSECHTDSDLKPLHGGTSGCATCHPNPRNQITWDKTCIQCHNGTLAGQQHDDLPAHIVTKAGCISTTCHVGGNVAAIHVKAGVQKCNACHNGQPLKTDCTSAAPCHGSTDPHPAHPATPAAATITGYGSADLGVHACSECHASDLKVLHGNTTTDCIKCHPSPRNSFTTYNGACAQGGCHTANVGNMKTQHGHIGTAHATVDYCHDEEYSHNNRWNKISGTFDVSLIHPSCGTCHDPNGPLGGWLPANGSCTNCHDDSHC